MRTLIVMGVVLAWAAGWPGKAEVERESGSGKAKSDTRPGGGELPDDEDKLRTAVVNIQELFRQYHKVKRAEEEINMERARIQKEHNDLAGRLRSMDQGLRELEARLRSTGLTDGERASLERKQGVRFQERELLRRERKASLVAGHAELNRKMVARMDVLLQEIRDLVASQAERKGYDLVFDLDGTNSSQVPMLLFAKDAIDITPMILKKLNESSPSRG